MKFHFLSLATFIVLLSSRRCIEVEEVTTSNEVEESKAELPPETLPMNTTIFNETSVGTNTTSVPNDTKKYANCTPIPQNSTESDEPSVALVNSTTLMKLLVTNNDITSKETEADCILVFFYAKSCPFSCQAAPHFNALARSYPNIKLFALDAIKHHTSNAHFGIVGVPTLKLFHNGRPLFKFNGTEYNIHKYSEFISSVTGQQPVEVLVRSKDFKGPVPNTLEQDLDYILIISWVFIIMCGLYYFTKSSWWKCIVDTIQNNWRESEAQHQHTD